MAWPAPNPGGVNFDSMANAEQIINHYNPNAPPNADAIEAEHQLIAQYNASSDELGRPLVPSDSDIQPGAGFSSSAAQRLLQGQAPPAGGSSGGGGGSGSNSGTNKPTIETRKSLQARGKNFHSSSTAKTQGRAWEERQRRDEAVSILESEEMVMWIAGVRNESIPQTRAYYRNIVLGLEQPPAVWKDEWEVQGSASAEGQGGVIGSASPARSSKGKERDIGKMRKRVSSGQATA